MFRFFTSTCAMLSISHEPSASNPLTAANTDNPAPQNGRLIREQPPETDECRGVAAAAAANPRPPNAPFHTTFSNTGL
jgi:hypothetical protein